MITYEWSDSRNGNIWWIQSVYVKPDFRGAGVFKALFDQVDAQGAEKCGGGLCAAVVYGQAQ